MTEEEAITQDLETESEAVIIKAEEIAAEAEATRTKDADTEALADRNMT
jgi:hypothetical protein